MVHFVIYLQTINVSSPLNLTVQTIHSIFKGFRNYKQPQIYLNTMVIKHPYPFPSIRPVKQQHSGWPVGGAMNPSTSLTTSRSRSRQRVSVFFIIHVLSENTVSICFMIIPTATNPVRIIQYPLKNGSAWTISARFHGLRFICCPLGYMC